MILATSRCGAVLWPAHRPASAARPNGKQTEGVQRARVYARPAAPAQSWPCLCSSVVYAALSSASNLAQAQTSSNSNDANANSSQRSHGPHQHLFRRRSKFVVPRLHLQHDAVAFHSQKPRVGGSGQVNRARHLIETIVLTLNNQAQPNTSDHHEPDNFDIIRPREDHHAPQEEGSPA